MNLNLRHSPDGSADMSAWKHQQHTEKERTKVAVCSQNELDGGKDASRPRDTKGSGIETGLGSTRSARSSVAIVVVMGRRHRV